MAALGLAAGMSGLLWAVSGFFRPKLASRRRVVMQWGFNGKPNSWAPPWVALSATPVVGTIALLASWAFAVNASPPDDQAAAFTVLVLVGGVLAAVHAAHLYFAVRAPD